MPRTSTATQLAILDKLEPEAKAAWEAEELGLPEAIAASQAITDKRNAEAQATIAQAEKDARTIEIKTLDPTVQDTLPPDLRTRHDPDYQGETP